MAEIIRMPRLSDTMEEGNIVSWLKKEGDSVKPGDILAEVETDKATMELESFHAGTLIYIGVKSGPVAVDGIIAIIGSKEDDVQKILAGQSSADTSSHGTSEAPKANKEETIANSAAEPIQKSSSVPSVSSPQPSVASDQRLKASPLAKSLASQSGIDIANVVGTGDFGRIVKKDIEDFLKNPTTSATSTESMTASDSLANFIYGDVPVSQMRKTIARRLGESKFTAPHFYLTVEINMDAAVESREAINKISPVKISYNDMVVKACSGALRKNPAINASWFGDKITYHKDIHIGIAVAVEDGLLVPVINHADQKSMTTINLEVKELAGKAKSKKLQPQEMTGNTFTISNLGMFDIEEFTAIINPPDACILAVGSIIKKPIVKNNNIVIGNMMKVTLSCDHRVVDGAKGAQFLQTLKSYLENPVLMLV
ncbi:MAG: pyruvate dehydrogenase complex dihydrolipoamide acetyltransferase [Saprospiraceae bacterium]